MNGAGSFSDAATEAFSPVDRHGCDHADVDHDGNKDILCAVGAQRGKAIRRHELSLAPDKPGRQLVRAAWASRTPWGAVATWPSSASTTTPGRRSSSATRPTATTGCRAPTASTAT